jgi:nucleoside-diphosphate-sugar epimerase
VVRRLLQDGYAVMGASVEPSTALGIPYRQVDITDRLQVEALFGEAEVSAALHLAALVHNKSKDLSFAVYERINAQGSRNVFECAQAHGVQRLLFASTIEVYGETEAAVVSEDAPKSPKTFYAISKKMAEDSLFGMEGSMQRTAMRFAPVYARDFTLNLDKRIYAVRGKWAYYFKDGGYRFHFCSVNVILDFITHWLGTPSIQGVFNIADRDAVSARELIGLAKEANPALKILKLPYAPALAAIWCVEKVLRILGKKDSMLSIYNFRKLFRSARWDVTALYQVMPDAPDWNVKNTLYPR